MGSRENLGSPLSPGDPAQGADWQGTPRKSSLMSEPTDSRRKSVQEPAEHHQSTSEMFKDMLSQKRNMILSKLTSFDSEVSYSEFQTLTATFATYPRI